MEDISTTTMGKGGMPVPSGGKAAKGQTKSDSGGKGGGKTGKQGGKPATGTRTSGMSKHVINTVKSVADRTLWNSIPQFRNSDSDCESDSDCGNDRGPEHDDYEDEHEDMGPSDDRHGQGDATPRAKPQGTSWHDIGEEEEDWMDDQVGPFQDAREQREETELAEQRLHDEGEQHEAGDIDDRLADEPGVTRPCADKNIQAARDAYLNAKNMGAPPATINYFSEKWQNLTDATYPRKVDKSVLLAQNSQITQSLSSTHQKYQKSRKALKEQLKNIVAYKEDIEQMAEEAKQKAELVFRQTLEETELKKRTMLAERLENMRDVKAQIKAQQEEYDKIEIALTTTSDGLNKKIKTTKPNRFSKQGPENAEDKKAGGNSCSPITMIAASENHMQQLSAMIGEDTQRSMQILAAVTQMMELMPTCQPQVDQEQHLSVANAMSTLPYLQSLKTNQTTSEEAKTSESDQESESEDDDENMSQKDGEGESVPSAGKAKGKTKIERKSAGIKKAGVTKAVAVSAANGPKHVSKVKTDDIKSEIRVIEKELAKKPAEKEAALFEEITAQLG